MNDLFSTIFNWLSSMFGQDWDNFLYDAGVYTYFGLILLILPAVIASVFYYTPTVRFNGRIKWFLFMLVTLLLVALCTFGVGDYFLQNADNLDQYGSIAFSDKFGTAFIGGFWGCVWFFLLSVLMMHNSVHNYKVPFKS